MKEKFGVFVMNIGICLLFAGVIHVGGEAIRWLLYPRGLDIPLWASLISGGAILIAIGFKIGDGE